MSLLRRWLVQLPLLAAGRAAVAEPARETVVYVRDGCPHCAEAKAFLADLAAQRPQLRIVYRPVDADAAAREELEALSRELGIWPPGVPTFLVGGYALIGLDDGRHTGRDIVALLDGAAPPPPAVESRLFGTAVAALGSRKLGERGGRRLKLLSGAAILALGAVLLLQPQWLAGAA